MENNYPRSRKDSLVVQEVDGEVLIYDLDDNKAFCLNKTSAVIWELCDGKRSLSEIDRLASKKLKSPASEGLVWLALTQLKKENLIENEIPAPIALQGLSRREVIKRVGLASVVAIPIVSSLVAPTGANAASGGLALEATCANPPQCSAAASMCSPNPQGAGGMHCCVGTGGFLRSDGVIGGEEVSPATPCASVPVANRTTRCGTSFSTSCCTGMSISDVCNTPTGSDWHCICN